MLPPPHWLRRSQAIEVFAVKASQGESRQIKVRLDPTRQFDLIFRSDAGKSPAENLIRA